MKKKSWSPHLRIQTHATIGLIPQNRRALLGKVDPDLVRASGEGPCFDQSDFSKRLEQPEPSVSRISPGAY